MTTRHMTIAGLLLMAACGEAGPTRYEDMDFEQREAFMNEVVLPEMRETFVAFDAKFAGMSCVTCHGQGAVDGTYAMPSPDLPRLPATMPILHAQRQILARASRLRTRASAWRPRDPSCRTRAC